jgi:L-asparaginase/Glu-tRNA(Gln) amidotransferase subunit D
VEPGVALFTVHPGFQPAWIEQAVRRNVRAIVLAGYGSGTACASGAFDLRPALRLAAEKGVAVWMVSQHGGRVGPVYGSTAALVREGVSLRPGWTPEAALTALMCRRDLDALSPRA